MPNTFYNAFDIERMQNEEGVGDYRSPFQKDRDRILHTPSFRSLQSKTQVFWSGEYDFYRTRLTHSLEVAQIGKSICAYLQHSSDYLNDERFIDADLVEASCLSHDLGHPPFGHAGERTLNGLMFDDGGFEGNAQTLRLLTERIFSISRRGMNPTRAFLDSILKYKTLWGELKSALSKEGREGESPKNHFIYDQQLTYLEWVMAERDFPIENTPGDQRDAFKSVECQVMDWADDTAYSLNDISDSVRAGFITIEKVEEWASKQDLSQTQSEVLEELCNAIRRGRVDVMVGRKIGDSIQSVLLTEDVNFMSAETNRYKYRLITDPTMSEVLKILKKLSFEIVFSTPELNQLEHKGHHILSYLWEVLSKRYVDGEGKFKLISDHLAEEFDMVGGAADGKAQRKRILCDYLSTLTDGQAVRLYKRLVVPDYGSIADLV